MDTIQRQSIDQNLRKLAETAGFADIYTQDYSGYFKDIKVLYISKPAKNTVPKIYHQLTFLALLHSKMKSLIF